MRIAVIAKLFAPITQTSTMGQEKFIYELAKKLQEKKHEVTLFTTGDSKVEGLKQINVLEKSFWNDFYIEKNKEGTTNIIRNALKEEFSGYTSILYYLNKHQSDFDIIHDNSCHEVILSFQKYLTNLPFLSTVHVFPEDLKKIQEKTNNENLRNHYIAISQKQIELASPVEIFDKVYNGIDINKFNFNNKGGTKTCFVGRIDPNKGPEEAIGVIKQLDLELDLAGSIVDQNYYDSNIKPKLTDKISYKGVFSGTEMSKFYGNHKVTILPFKGDEPFGFVSVESMACGTLVIAFDRGAASEIIKNGVTGFVVPKDNLKAMKEAIEKIYNMSEEEYLKMRAACRKHAEETFTLDKMIENYENIYSKVIKDWGANHE